MGDDALSSPLSEAFREESEADEASSPSWAGDAPSAAEELDEASSSDGEAASYASPTPARPKIKLKRSVLREAAAADIDGGGDNDTDAAYPSMDNSATLTPDPSAGTKRKRPVKQLRAKPLQAALSSLLAAFKKRDPYLFFHNPVNPDEVPGYRDVIQFPMDLGTMEKRLASRHYTNMALFQADFLLVTQNAQVFNPSSSIYHTAARRLETWGLRAIEREGLSVVEDDTFVSDDAHDTPPPRSARGWRRRMGHRRETSLGAGTDYEETDTHEGRHAVRIGSARSTRWSPTPPQGVPNTPEMNLFRKTLAFAGVSRNALTGKSACSARMHAKPKARLGPLPSFLAEQCAATNGGEPGDADAEMPWRAYAYLDDGSLDPAALGNLPEFLIQRMGSAPLLLPVLESLRHLPMYLATTTTSTGNEATFVFPNAQSGHPDALFDATLSAPSAPATDWSHSFRDTSVPEHDREMPFAIAAAPGPSGLGATANDSAAQTTTKNGGIPVWPIPAPPPIQDPLQVGLRLNRRERELEQERDEQNWTFFRPHLQRMIMPSDLAMYGDMPAWAATGGDPSMLRSYGWFVGPLLTRAVREYLRAMPYRVLGLPRTAQYVPRSSLRQLPPALQIAMQGAQEAERLVDVVYGSVDGLAYVRSLAEFVDGAQASVEEEVAVKMEETGTLPIAHDDLAAPSTLPGTLQEYVFAQKANLLTGQMLGLLVDAGKHLSALSVPSGDAALPDTLVSLLDDPQGATAHSLWQTLYPGATSAPPLSAILSALVDTERCDRT
ncbi:hypothetical protein MVES1_002508 [Malassezia vespertilionis]|uniref:Bromo domain-containing protein n=1 Tax=Malassezia vespertilionis TaxID=2020962 RepID=A0A2N1J9W5_9BASI|nr:uncharacterized protein MVES1_002508 [Malassezia vespertilionis]PKI83351.1 hypothetical protein MVES_002367 [Malassezia vespertilionis]WFD07150.1 hypothetical protein MVES1_002508 [Malassezia vespertilionis]